jgi:glutamine synthetase
MASSTSRAVVVAEYIFCGGKNTYNDIRSKIKTLVVDVAAADALHARVEEGDTALAAGGIFPEWNYDGSSTGQAQGALGCDTEILIRPVRAFVHPLLKDQVKGGRAYVVLADCYLPSGEPTPCNTRVPALEAFKAEGAADTEPWFGLEQEYVITIAETGVALAWAKGEPAPQGDYYCGTGATRAIGRELAVEHYATALSMGLRISGMNAEVMPSQWEYQIGPCVGIEGGDHSIVARWLLRRLAEPRGLDVCFDSKPNKAGDWNGSGMHCNFSTAAMRAPGGAKAIDEALVRMGKNPVDDLLYYGADNHHRLTGKHETSRPDTFTHSIGGRATSVRVPNSVKADGCGYLEDRRPSGSADPYLVTARLFASCTGIVAPLLEQRKAALTNTWFDHLRKGVILPAEEVDRSIAAASPVSACSH